MDGKMFLSRVIFMSFFVAARCESPPNIVIIIADDLGIGDIGCFGNDTIKTPNLDNMAREGARLTHHLAAESVCTPSRAALLTGRYPVRIGMASTEELPMIFFLSSTAGLPQTETTIAEMAKSKGYSTALIGKWHLGLNCRWLGDNCHHPLSQGFDYFFGIPLTNMRSFGDPKDTVVKRGNKYFTHKYFLTMAVGVIFAVLLLKMGRLSIFYTVLLGTLYCLIPSYFYISAHETAILNGLVMRNYDYVEQPIRLENMTKRLVREGVNFLEQQKKQERPFLLVMSWLQVHSALHTGPDFAGVSRHGKYGDNVQEMDWSTGEIIKALDRLGLKNDTLVYFTSDNGPHLEDTSLTGEPEGGSTGMFKGGKFQSGTEGGIRMPTLMMWPNHIPRKLDINVPTSQMDIFPTVRNLLNIQPEPGVTIDGKDIAPLVMGSTRSSPHKFLWHYCSKSLHSARYMPTEGDDIWKVYYVTHDYLHPDTYRCDFACPCYSKTIKHNPPILYNIAKDPSEKHPIDINADEKYQDALHAIEEARKEHEVSLKPVTDQLTFLSIIWMPHLQPCCNFPTCNCEDRYGD